jgi:transposase
MIGTTRQVRVHVFDAPVDMRRSFDGLHALVTNQMGSDALSGDLFLFVSKNRRRAKVLYWDGTGLCVFAKRLEQGHFASPWDRASDNTPMKLTASELALFLEELTASELALFLEGCEWAGKVPLSPAPMSFEQFTHNSN